MMLSGKIALVTGARGGIGRAIVARFLKEGAIVYAADLTPEGSLEQHDDDGSRFVKLDVTNEKEAIAAMGRVREEQGKLDILVNAAGIEIEKMMAQGSLRRFPLSQFHHLFSERLGRGAPSEALSGRAVQAVANRLHIAI